MHFTPIRSWWDSRTRWEKTALFIWSVLLLVVCVRVFFQPDQRTVYPIFSGSAQLWWSGEDLYEPDRPTTVQGGYRYTPTFAILLTPLAIFPDSVGGVLWRLVSAAALVGALAWLRRSVVPFALSRDRFAWLTLLCLPLTVQSLNNGQANLIVIAAMLATVAAVCAGRWNLAAGMMALAFVCKIYPLALGLLLIGLYPRQLSWRIGLAVLVSLLTPFLCQHPAYVLDQYDKWIVLLRADDRTFAAREDMHRDLWLLVDIYGIPLGRPLYRLLQIGGGIGVAALLWWRQRHGWTEKALLTSTLALAVTWMLALGPVVESSTFVLLAPSFACSALAALQGPWRWRNLLLAVSAVLFVLAASAGSIANTAKLHVIGLHPWATLLYFAFLLLERRPQSEQSIQAVNDRRAAA